MIKRIGILGGTFDPIHNGHINLAKIACDELNLGSVMFIPSGVSYMKSNVSPSSDRFAMTELAVKDIPSFSVSDIEVTRSGNSYTYETLEELNRLNPDTEFVFIVGADTFLSLDKWKCVGRILRAASIAVLTRDHVPDKILKAKAADYKRIFNAKVFFLNAPEIDISSTDIKKLIKNGEAFEELLPPSVYSYIKELKLYV